MNFAVLGLLIALSPFQSQLLDQFRTPIGSQSYGQSAGRSYYNSQRPIMYSPLSGSVLVTQAIRSGRIRVPFLYRTQVNPFVLTCSPAPCTTPNNQASEGGSPVNETPIAVDPNNKKHLLSGGNDYNCPNVQGFFASSNGGTTWNHTCMAAVSGGAGEGDPAVGYDLNHTAYAAALDAVGSNSDVILEKSTNNGGTWSSPTIAVTGISPYTFVDKEWMQIDNTPTSRWPNWIYISDTEFDSSNNTIIAVAHSSNGGGSFTNVMVDAATFPLIDQFSDLAISADGTVYVSWMRCSATGPTGDCGGTQAMELVSKSNDGGNTWSAPKVIAKPNLLPDSCGAFYGCLPNTSERISNIPAIDVDRSTGPNAGRLYAIYYNWTGNQCQVLVRRSKNGGSTWSKGVRVAPGAVNDEFFPWLTTSKTGEVGATWLDRRLDSSNINYDAFGASSTDGGLTFSANLRISTMSSNPFNDGFGSGFMGDYTGNIWAGNTVYQSWTDTRSGIAQDEVGGMKP